MPKVNFGQVLKEIGGRPLTNLNEEAMNRALIDLINQAVKGKWPAERLVDRVVELGATREPVILKKVCINALGQGQEGIDGYEKLKRFKLMMKLDSGGEVELSVEEIMLIKTSVDKAYPSPLVVGQAWNMLDPQGEAKEKKSPRPIMPGKKR